MIGFTGLPFCRGDAIGIAMKFLSNIVTLQFFEKLCSELIIVTKKIVWSTLYSVHPNRTKDELQMNQITSV